MDRTEPKLELTYASSIENVDFAFYDWLDKDLNLICNSKDGLKKVPVIWVTPERAYQVKQNKEFRDIDGTLNVPMITVERTSINKDVKNNGTYYTSLPPNTNRHIVAKRINQKKTSEFANADKQKKYGNVNFVSPKKNEKIVYQYDSMLLPVYVNFTYNITIFTQFQQQMNELLQPFITRTGSTRYFLIEKDGYKYECFIEPNFDTKNNVASMEEEERRYVTNVTVKILANLVSDGLNQEDSVIKTYENIVELKFPRNGIEITDRRLVYTNEIKNLSEATQLYSTVTSKKVFLIGNNLDSKYRIIHNFNTKDVLVSIRSESTASPEDLQPNIVYSDENYIDLEFSKPVKSNYYYVTIMG